MKTFVFIVAALCCLSISAEYVHRDLKYISIDFKEGGGFGSFKPYEAKVAFNPTKGNLILYTIKGKYSHRVNAIKYKGKERTFNAGDYDVFQYQGLDNHRKKCKVQIWASNKHSDLIIVHYKNVVYKYKL